MKGQSNMMIFEKKYAPRMFGDLIFPDSNTRQRCWEFSKNLRNNSMIFHGPYGTAKTTTARLLTEMREAGLEAGGVDFYRASDITINTFERIRNTQSIKRMAGVAVPVTIIDEIDKVDNKLQYMMRWELDMRELQGCYIFTTNALHAVDKGLVDRCDDVNLPSAQSEFWRERAAWILQQEGVALSATKLDALLATCNGSIRDLLRGLEDAALRQPRAA
jgi:replication-associated recombination protein RarA